MADHSSSSAPSAASFVPAPAPTTAGSAAALPSKLLVANRGEIAIRLCKTAKKLGVATVAIYTKPDIGSSHVRAADERQMVDSYLDERAIVDVALNTGCDAVIPGYGFISESRSFAELCERNGLVFCGPRPEVLSTFGLKHTAREAAKAAAVPICPGTDVLESGAAALEWANASGVTYPILFKVIAGGGGIGMVEAHSVGEVESAYETASRNALKSFGDGRVYVEQMLLGARHIEVQIFGDGDGHAVSLGTRECSVQRRNQKVIEEAPAPNLPGKTRSAIEACACQLASSVGYNSAGTVEFLVDASGSNFYFLEVNTRLQVEHGVTELVYGVDLVECMLRQGNGKNPPSAPLLPMLRRLKPKGSAIECRLYAEDCTNNFLPSPGVLGEVSFPTSSSSSSSISSGGGGKGKGTPSPSSSVRVDTWVCSGTEVTADFDPLLAKIMTHGTDRQAAVERMQSALKATVIKGSTTNLEYLQLVCANAEFVSGKYDLQLLTRVGMLAPRGMKVKEAGFYSSIQDYPGRCSKNGELGEFWRIGIPPSGPMDDFSSRLANALLGNDEEAATLEFTLRGPTVTFLEATVIAVVGADFSAATLDGRPMPLHTSIAVGAGATLSLGSVAIGAGGQRGYLAVAGGFDVPLYLGSRSTFPLGKMGGHQGRPLLSGDILPLVPHAGEHVKVNVSCTPPYMPPQSWEVGCVIGPHASPDFHTDASMRSFFGTYWRVHHNSNRNGVRLLGPKPEWARPDGGSGGSHPSNVIDNEYAVGTINFTGDMPIFIGRDGPSLGGFVCNVTVPQAELWKMGQVKPDDLISFTPLPMSECLKRRSSQVDLLRSVYESSECEMPPPLADPIGLSSTYTAHLDRLHVEGNAVLYHTRHSAKQQQDAGSPNHPITPPSTYYPDVTCRLQGDEYVLLEYGPPEMDLRLRFRVEAIERYLRATKLPGLLETAPGVRSLQVRYDNTLLSLEMLERLLRKADHDAAHVTKVTTRVLHLPCVLHDRWCKEAVDKYTQSNQAANGSHWSRPYLPDNSEFVARQNGLKSVEAVHEIILKASYLVLGLGDVYLGCPAALPVDPTHRLMNPKYNPARTYTPQGAIGIGGTFMCLYPTASPGGYQLVGRSLPIWNAFCVNRLYEEGRPWLLRMFDQVRFYEVGEAELEDCFERFQHGLYTPALTYEDFDVNAYTEWIETPEMVEKAAAFEEQRKRGEASIDWSEPQPNALAALAESYAASLSSTLTSLLGDSTRGGDAVGEGTPLLAPCSANVWRVHVKQGEAVEVGQDVVTLEAMKMEYAVKAEVAGIVKAVLAVQGSSVKQGDPLVSILAAATAAATAEVEPSDVSA